MKPIKRCGLLLLACSVLLMTGCWDRREINDVGFVLATAVDLEDDGKYRVTVQISLPGQMGGASGGGGGTGGDKSYYIDSDTGKTVGDAINKMQNRMSRFMTTSHVRVNIIGEELAKKEGIVNIFASMGRGTEFRLSSYMIIAKGKGYDLLNAEPKFERFPAEALRELVKPLQITVKDVADSMSIEGQDSMIPYMGVVESQKGAKPSKEISFEGYALFDQGKMTGNLSGGNAVALGFLTNRRVAFTTLQITKDESIELFVTGGRLKIKSKLVRNKPEFDIHASAAVTIVENESMMDVTHQSNNRKIEEKLSKQFEVKMTQMLAQLQENKSDAVGFGRVISREFPGEWKRMKNNWKEQGFPNSKFHVHVSTNITRSGLISENIVKKEPKL
ncbi:hypothetical protein SY83_12910 [Paenibacillus swuensis]|uniref:Uncharacterized protein n=1 Tax=Paenibacillus swuensis TaxID=1178515 RepID=A0A172TJ33_9BACL|nr:Ger(x)C family spore germination protein [Paenibacillus swuensis]ANE47020.1 hypothetical protein SY83_12910 [Paenibacillus swuensis]